MHIVYIRIDGEKPRAGYDIDYGMYALSVGSVAAAETAVRKALRGRAKRARVVAVGLAANTQRRGRDEADLPDGYSVDGTDREARDAAARIVSGVVSEFRAQDRAGRDLMQRDIPWV